MREFIRKWLGIEDKKEYIGEAYIGFFQGMSISSFCDINTSFGPGQYVHTDFHKFKEKDVSEYRKDEIKVLGTWVPRERVIFYKDQYEEQKKNIINKIKKEKNENQ